MATEEKAAAPVPAKAVISLVHLKHALTVAKTALPHGGCVIPILNSFRIEELKEGLAVEATDLDIAVRALIPETPGLARPLAIPSDRFPDWVKLLDGEEVKLSAKEMRVTLQAGTAKMVAPLMNLSAWPQTLFGVSSEGISLPQAVFARALKFAAVTTSKEESRYTINSALMHGDGATMRLISTDGHRMTVYSFPSREIIDVLLPARFVKVMLSLLQKDGDQERVTIAFDGGVIVASLPGEMPIFISSRRSTGTFPKWEQVVPTHEVKVIARVKEFLAAMERCALLSDPTSAAAKLTFNMDGLRIESRDTSAGEAEETVSCHGHPPLPITVGVNATYVIDLLKGIDGEVRIALPSVGTSAILFIAEPHDGERLNYVVMPIRI